MSINFNVGDHITDWSGDRGTVTQATENRYLVHWDCMDREMPYWYDSRFDPAQLEHRKVGESPAMTAALKWKEYQESDELSPHEIKGFNDAMENLCKSLGVDVDYAD